MLEILGMCLKFLGAGCVRNSIWVLELLVIWQLPTGTVPCKNIRFSQIYLPFSPCILVNH